jgi:hypothetical protein
MRRLKLLLILATICVSGFGCLLYAQEQFPVGTVVAIVLDHPVDSRHSKPGQRVVAYIAQEVPLENKRVIRARSKVFGEVTQVENGPGVAKLGLRFNRIQQGKEQIAISAQARAIASPMVVADASIPTNMTTASGNSLDSGTTIQIGGDAVYGRRGGKVQTESGEVVGKSVPGGVLVSVRNRPGSPCAGMPLSKTPQALWSFSASACGVYGISRFQFENRTNANADEILFTRHNKYQDKQTDVKLQTGTALLLAITRVPDRK